MTTQIKDTLIFNGARYSIDSLGLSGEAKDIELLFRETVERLQDKSSNETFAEPLSEPLGPLDIWLNKTGLNIFQLVTPHEEDFIPALISCCWRGYVATWRIHEEKLLLDDVLLSSKGDQVSLEAIFPKWMIKSSLNFAWWYSGSLKISRIQSDKNSIDTTILNVVNGKIFN